MTGPARRLAFCILAASVLAIALPSAARANAVPDGGTVTEPENQSCGNARDAIADIESRGSGGYQALSRDGFLGRYQIGEAKLQDLGYTIPDGKPYDNRFQWSQKARDRFGISSNQDFLNNSQAQEQIYTEINDRNRVLLNNVNAYNHIGKATPCAGNPPLNETMLLAAAQFGHGKVAAWLNNGMQCVPGKGSVTNDGNGKCVDVFVCAVGGCNTIEKDMSKRTCSTTMPMIEAISCGNFEGSLRSFCNTYRPYLMTRAECQSAEEMSESAPKGPNEDKCENSSFGPGSGSWSYVLACSWASDAVADQDGASNPSGPVSDPACIENLRGMGVQFDVLGRHFNGTSGGTTCYIENAVSLSGTAIPFGTKMTLTCDMAIAMERYGQQMRAQGATGYYDIYSLRTCGPMIDGSGPKPGTITEHALGRAVDVGGFIVGGRRVSMGALFSPGTPDGAFAETAKNIACSTFRGVLSPTYAAYQRKFVHFHLEWGNLSGVCR